MADEYGKNAAGEIVHYDEYGVAYILDEAGNKHPPSQSARNSKEGEFTTYDDSRGHCGLCGSIYCRGSCFK